MQIPVPSAELDGVCQLGRPRPKGGRGVSIQELLQGTSRLDSNETARLRSAHPSKSNGSLRQPETVLLLDLDQ